MIHLWKITLATRKKKCQNELLKMMIAEASTTCSLNISYTKLIMISSHSLAHSSQIAYQNMLVTKLTEFLQKHFLWKCQENHRTIKFKQRHAEVQSMNSNTEVTVYSITSDYKVKMSSDQKIAAHKHQKLQKSIKISDSIKNYDSW